MPKGFRRVKTAAKNVLRYVNYGKVKTPIFVLGCQRSGTTMILDIMDQCPKIHSVHEGYGVIMDKEYFRLVSDDAVRQAISDTPEPIILFKPLNDSQYIDRLLGLHPNAKAIWVYRQYRDVVDSAVKKWKDLHRTMINEVSRGEYSNPGREAIGERVTPENLEMIKEFAVKDLSPEDGAALLWYLRNSIFFDMGLDKNPKVVLYKYEDLVQHPERRFHELFDFVGAKYSPKYIATVHAGSVNKKAMSKIDPDIEAVCESLIARLNTEYQKDSANAAEAT